MAARAGAHGPALLERAQSAFMSGFSTALLVGACGLFAAGVVIAIVAPPRADLARAGRGRHQPGATTA